MANSVNNTDDKNKMTNEGGAAQPNQNRTDQYKANQSEQARIDQERSDQHKADSRKGDDKNMPKQAPGDKRFTPMANDAPSTRPESRI